jgi:predicted SnoaL-like aldol condensation-catalyzing enzyme
MSEQNKAIVRRVVDETWNSGDMSSAGELIAAGYRQHSSQLPPFEGVEALPNWYRGFGPAFPMPTFRSTRRSPRGMTWCTTGLCAERSRV